MTFDEFEVHARREIEKYLNRKPFDGNRSGHWRSGLVHSLQLVWRSITDDSDVNFTVVKDSITVQFTVKIEPDDKSKEKYFSTGTTDKPTSEEEYFQMSTVQELGFRWEFYEYLYDTFEKLK